MRLPKTPLSIADQLAEFDIWITPALGEIRDTERFGDEMEAVIRVFDRLSHASADFVDESHCQPAAIVSEYEKAIATLTPEESEAALVDLAVVLFLVTGRSDNNAKCQLPLFLKNSLGWSNVPTARISGGKPKRIERPIPRSLDSEKFMGLIASLGPFPADQRRTLRAFVEYVLASGRDIEQLWSVGRSYALMKKVDRHRQLLTPLVSFQVRGSVAASGGHEPERILRALMLEWGMRAGIDFNEQDTPWPRYEAPGDSVGIARAARRPPRAADGAVPMIVPADSAENTGKRRAWDFVLPFETDGWQPGIFVQSQFYAGDSGSVSHKNVDQTPKARERVKAAMPAARFVELVDGAGYFSALNGDLKHLLEMADTSTFVQLRSAPIRLRRELQELGFLAPLEVAQCVLTTDGTRTAVRDALRLQGYSAAEVSRGMEAALTLGWTSAVGEQLSVTDSFRQTTRRYAILDCVAVTGSALAADGLAPKGFVFVPGFGTAYGTSIDSLIRECSRLFSGLAHDFRDSLTFNADITWLAERGFVIVS